MWTALHLRCIKPFMSSPDTKVYTSRTGIIYTDMLNIVNSRVFAKCRKCEAAGMNLASRVKRKSIMLNLFWHRAEAEARVQSGPCSHIQQQSVFVQPKLCHKEVHTSKWILPATSLSYSLHNTLKIEPCKRTQSTRPSNWVTHAFDKLCVQDTSLEVNRKGFSAFFLRYCTTSWPPVPPSESCTPPTSLFNLIGACVTLYITQWSVVRISH